jgi:TonB family protein
VPAVIKTDSANDISQPSKQQTSPLTSAKKSETSAESHPEDQTPENVYEQATPLSGYPALYEYFNDALVYPAEHVGDSIHGDVTVIFVIDVAGKPVNIQVEKSLGPRFDAEAIRVINNMPAWEPAKFNGKPVPSKIRLPLTFETEKITID